MTTNAEWLKKYRQASFRGVKFFVESHDLSGGRRGAQHEYAQRDKPFFEDTGRKARKFNLDGYVLGDNYTPLRDSLYKALEQEGSGELIHPYLGRQIVNCTDFKIRESNKDGGIATFSMSFSESGEVDFPSASDDTGFEVLSAADLNIANAKANFENRFSTDNRPQFLKNDAIAKIRSYTDQAKALADSFTVKNNVINDFAYAIQNFSAAAVDLIEKPAELAAQFADSMRLLRQASDSPNEVFAALKKLFGFGEDDSAIETSTPTRQQQSENRDSMNDIIVIIALSEGAVAAEQISFPSLNDANSVKSSIVDKIDEQSESINDDELFQSLKDLRAATAKGVPSPDQNLAFLSKVVLLKSTPSLVLSYDLYEALDLEQDIIDRNKVANPAFVPGGVDLEVLQLE